MLATVIALIIAAIFYLRDVVVNPDQLHLFSTLIFSAGIFFLFLPVFASCLAWNAIQKAEKKTPAIAQLYHKDILIYFFYAIAILFSLTSIFISFDFIVSPTLTVKTAIIVWIVLLGLSIDAIYHLVRHTAKYMDSFYVIDLYSKKAHASILAEKDLELFGWIDVISESAINAIQKIRISVCNHALNSLQYIARVFLDSSKSIARPDTDIKIKEDLELQDEVSYTLFYILQRYEMIGEKAIEQRIEPVCHHLISSIGKMTIDAAKCDFSLPPGPLHYLGKIALAAQTKGMSEIGPKTISILLEIAKTIVQEIDLSYTEIQSTFLTLDAQLEKINKQIFTQDKTISIQLLQDPFLQLRELFTSEKMQEHRDTPTILADIDRVLADYEALDQVLRAIPPLPIAESKE